MAFGLNMNGEFVGLFTGSEESPDEIIAIIQKILNEANEINEGELNYFLCKKLKEEKIFGCRTFASPRKWFHIDNNQCRFEER